MTGTRSPKVMLLARKGEPWLLGSYGRALEQLGVDVAYWDLEAAVSRAVRFGRLGRRVHSVVGVWSWQTRANRELIVASRAEEPDALLIPGIAAVEAGALAQIKVALPDIRLVLVWPDTLLNLPPHTIAALPVYDLVATYSERSVDLFRKLGARLVRWTPFAADIHLFKIDAADSGNVPRNPTCDIVFIGNHRPERERAILALLDSGLTVHVWGGPSWMQSSSDRARARRYWQGRVVYGQDFVSATRTARLSLNVIDDTNYPAANMRFFETLACRMPALVSDCPEMSSVFPDGVGVAYFGSGDELVSKAKALVPDTSRRAAMTEAGYRQMLDGHTYEHRAQDLLAAVGLHVPR